MRKTTATWSAPHWRVPTLQRKISALFLLFGLALTLGLSVQGNLSQQLILHPIWEALLKSGTQQYLAGGNLPTTGPIRGWRLGTNDSPDAMPVYFAGLAPGFYDEEAMDEFESDSSHAVLVTPVGNGERIVMAADITDLENDQNWMAVVSVGIALASAITISCAIVWVYCSLRRPIALLAQRLDALDPEQPAQRMATDFTLYELHDIAVIVNGHLERVERFIERERSLLDQASHEFRTPIAVIAGAVDVLKLYELPPAAGAPLERIASTTANLNEIMAALLFLSREADGRTPLETTRLDALVAVLIDDHQHLLDGKDVQFVVETLEPLAVDCPEAIARIVVGNLLRNAAENSYQGDIRVSLAGARLSIQDSGAGFDTVAAARRYKQALRDSTKQGGGQGLGLFLTRRVCERFGWTLKISSDPARGTLAEMVFPTSARQRVGAERDQDHARDLAG